MREREESLEDKYVKEKNKLGPISEGKRASICKPRLLALAGQQKRQETKNTGNLIARQHCQEKRQATKKPGNQKGRIH